MHYLSGYPLHLVHVGRDLAGKWHLWPTVPDENFICQVMGVNTGWISCRHTESGGYRCEAQGPHDRHVFGQHTVVHARWGNGNSCKIIEGCLPGEFRE